MKKSNKILIVLLIAVCIAGMLATTVACDKRSPLNETVTLANGKTNCSVVITRNGETVYSYKNGEVENPHGLDVNAQDYIDTAATVSISLTAQNLKEGYSFEYNDGNGNVSLEATLTNTASVLGRNIDGAKLSVVGNIDGKTLEKYVVSYTDENGLEVTISLS